MPTPAVTNGDELVAAVTDALAKLESKGHFGPFAVALGQDFFGWAQLPNPNHQQVTPQDQIVPLLGGGSLPLLRRPDGPRRRCCAGWRAHRACHCDRLSAQFLLLNNQPIYVFRVYEKLALRIKSTDAVVTPSEPTS